MSFYGDTWADIYDSVHILTEDMAFWIDEARSSGGPVLELGCGTGRVAIPIAQAGVPVVGMDSSTAMLRIARAKARRLRLGSDILSFVRGDMRRFSLGRRFPLVIIPFRSFQLLLSVADQCQALEAIQQHLAPGGRLIVDLFVPDLGLLTRDPSTLLYDHDVTDEATGKTYQVWHQNRYDTFNQVVAAHTIVRQVDERGLVVQEASRDYQLRYLYRFEALHLLASCGYQVVDVYGGFDREPLNESSTEMVWVATPAS